MTKALPVRDDGRCNPSGLKLIEDMASDNKTQASIAAALGVSKKKFDAMLNRDKGECAERLAWERGRAVIEQRISDVLFASATGGHIEEEVGVDETGATKVMKVKVRSKTHDIAAMFYAKTQLGWQEKPTGPLILENRVNLTMSLPIPADEYFKMLGIEGPMDFRRDKTVPVPAGMKLVNPQDVRVLPAPAAPAVPVTPRKEDPPDAIK